MLSVVFVILLFTVNLKFSHQKKQTNLKTKVSLLEKKYEYILTDVININKDMGNMWKIVNDTRNAHDKNEMEMENIKTMKCPSTLSNELSRFEKGFHDEKQTSRKRWTDLKAKYENEVCKCDDTSILMDRKQGILMEMVNKISADQVTLRAECDEKSTDHVTDIDILRKEIIKLTERLTDNEFNVTHELTVINKQLSNENKQINKKYEKLKDELEMLRKVFPVSEKVQQKQKGWVEHGNSSYKYFSKRIMWSDSMTTCKSVTYGVGYLAEINNETEGNFVNDLVTGNRHYWLGGCDLDVEGDWKWCGTGSSMPFTNWWHVDEPNNYAKNGENCLDVYPSHGQWNDVDCTRLRSFVCELPLDM